MKTALMAGIGMTMLLLPAPAAAAADCTQIVQELNTLSATIARDANGYWTSRKTFIESKSVRTRNTAEATRASQIGDGAKTRSITAKSAMPMRLKNFAELTSAAKSQKCLPPEKLRELRETAFNRARAVNFDQLPTTPSSEGVPATAKPPRMPVR